MSAESYEKEMLYLYHSLCVAVLCFQNNIFLCVFLVCLTTLCCDKYLAEGWSCCSLTRVICTRHDFLLTLWRVKSRLCSRLSHFPTLGSSSQIGLKAPWHSPASGLYTVLHPPQPGVPWSLVQSAVCFCLASPVAPGVVHLIDALSHAGRTFSSAWPNPSRVLGA